MWKMDLDKLREIASGRPNAQSDATTQVRKVRKRSESVKVYVRHRADGVCGRCNLPAPFKDWNGYPYVEAHTSTREPMRDRTTQILSSLYTRIAIGESTQVRMGISSTNDLPVK